MAIARGNISHTLFDELISLFYALLGKLGNEGKVKEFEENFAKFIGRKYAHAYPFARTALYYVLKELDLPAKSRIVFPSITIKAFIDVALHFEYEPIFVDSDPKTGFADLVHLEEILKTDPDVLILTYLFGIVPDLESVRILIERYPTIVIEDFSQCLNGEYSNIKVGKVGNYSIYSCSAIKDVDTFGGGVLFHDSEPAAKKHIKYLSELNPPLRMNLVKKIFLSIIRNVFSQKLFFSTLTFPVINTLTNLGSHRFNKFVGERSLTPIGDLPKEWFQYYTSVQARLGLRILQKVEYNVAKRREVGLAYDRLDKSLVSVKSPERSHSVYWQYIVYPNDFTIFRKFLASRGIDCSQTSLVNVSNLELYGWRNSSFTAKWIHEKAVYIPCYSRLSPTQVKKILKALIEFQE